jgi:MFS family permease
LLSVEFKERQCGVLRVNADRLSPATIVWMLGASQIIGYGTLYYSFSILAEDIAKSLGVATSWLYGSFSLALLASAVLAPLIGRRIDRHGAAAVMAIGSGLCALTLLGSSLASGTISFTIMLVAMQAASTLVLYDAAFAALVQATGSEARLRITHLTLIAGFASTLFWPLTSWLHGLLGWREVFVIFAALNLFVCVPIHVLLARQQHHAKGQVLKADAEILPPQSEVSTLPTDKRRLGLWLLATAFALSSFALSAVLAQMVPTLAALGLGSSALIVSTFFGPAQVLVRFVNMLLGVKRHPMAAALVAFAMLPMALLMFMALAPMTIGGLLFVVLLGFGSGLKSIVQGTLPLALFGSGAYGARLGIMAGARQSLSAVAPFALAALISSIGPSFALLTVAGVGLLGFAALVMVARLQVSNRHSSA